MPFCANCGNQLGQTDKFCPSCGQPVTNQQEPATPVSAVPAAPVYTASVVSAEPVVSVKTKVLGFVGMGLSIGGLLFAVIGILYTFIGMIAEGYAGFIMAIVFGMFSMPLSIVGRALSNKSKWSTPSTVGSNLGLAGVIVTAVMLFFGFIGLVG